MSDDTTEMSEQSCPLCGDEYDDRQTFGPKEGPNKTDQSVELFYHLDRQMCSREIDD